MHINELKKLFETSEKKNALKVILSKLKTF